MITEMFLNACFSVILNKNTTIKKNTALFRDINEIIKFYQKNEKSDIPITIKSKLECLSEICCLKLENKTENNIIDSISVEKFRDLKYFLETKVEEELSDEVIYDNISQIRTRRKMISLLSNYKQLEFFIEKAKNNTYNSIDDITDEYEVIVKDMYSKLMESSRSVQVEASSSLDLLKDDYSTVVNSIRKKYDPTNTYKSGFSVLDNEVFKGGFEKSRLYIFAGGSGSGKSTLLINFIANDLLSKNALENKEKSNDDNKEKLVHIYITLENLVDESLMRLYQCMTQVNDIQFIRNINSSLNPSEYIKSEMSNYIKKSGRNIIFKYFPKYSISPIDIRMIIDDVISEYGKEKIGIVYIDYLDLLRLDNPRYDLYRLELSEITSGLKDIAVEYSIPIITATQLNREIYRDNIESRNLNLGMMSEATKKIDHADCIALMVKDQVEEVVHVKIGKNRSGKSNISLEFNVDFSMFKFNDGYVTSNKEKQSVDGENFNSSFDGIRSDLPNF